MELEGIRDTLRISYCTFLLGRRVEVWDVSFPKHRREEK